MMLVWYCIALSCTLQKPLKPEDCYCDNFKPIKLYGVSWRKAACNRRASVGDAGAPSQGEDLAVKQEQIQRLKQSLLESNTQVTALQGFCACVPVWVVWPCRHRHALLTVSGARVLSGGGTPRHVQMLTVEKELEEARERADAYRQKSHERKRELAAKSSEMTNALVTCVLVHAHAACSLAI